MILIYVKTQSCVKLSLLFHSFIIGHNTVQQLNGLTKALDYIDLLPLFLTFLMVFALSDWFFCLLSTNALQSLHKVKKPITLDRMLQKKV